MFQKILVPTDGSAIAEHAADVAIELARACRSEMIALSIAEPGLAIPSVEGAMVLDPGQQDAVLLEHAHGFAGAVAERALQVGVACTPVAKFVPDAARAIVEAVRDYACDLVVMGSHGRRGLRRLLAGSVAEAVLAHAPVPVLLMRPPVEDARVQAPARTSPADVRA